MKVNCALNLCLTQTAECVYHFSATAGWEDLCVSVLSVCVRIMCMYVYVCVWVYESVYVWVCISVHHLSATAGWGISGTRRIRPVPHL